VCRQAVRGTKHCTTCCNQLLHEPTRVLFEKLRVAPGKATPVAPLPFMYPKSQYHARIGTCPVAWLRTPFFWDDVLQGISQDRMTSRSSFWTKILRNVSNCSPSNTASYPEKGIPRHLLCLQQPTTSTCHEPDESIPRLRITFPYIF
jgi:hypothetical protein